MTAEKARWPTLGEIAQARCTDCAREALRAFWPGPIESRPQFSTPDDAAGILVPLLQGRDREHCMLLTLDSKHRLIDVVPVSVGSVDKTFMGPREIFRDALLQGASAVVLGHNHPSGEPTPSVEDRRVTRRLAEVGALLGVEVLDHLVVGDDWVSLAREGLL
jgi:DNA repair protein RadC